MLRRVALVRTDVSEERNSIIRVTKIGELGTLAVTSAAKKHPDNGDATFLGNVVSYKSHTA
jgi:hypothetical protein